MQDAFLVFLNILLVAGLGMWANAHWMDQVFTRRHSIVVFWGYFLLKTCVMFVLQYEKLSGGVPWLEVANAVFVSVTAILTVAAVVYTWKGAFAQVFLCAFACDMMNPAIMMAISSGISALHVGLMTGNEWHLVPLNLGTIVMACVFIALHFALNRPIVSLFQMLKRLIMRHELFWTALTWLFVAFESVGTAMANMQSVNFYADSQGLVALLLFSVLLLVVLRRAVRLSQRRQAVAACEALAQEYDAMVRAQLEELERGRVALAGHEQMLAEIGPEDDTSADKSVAREVRALEQKFRRFERIARREFQRGER